MPESLYERINSIYLFQLYIIKVSYYERGLHNNLNPFISFF
jgi:hypothetical protein